MKALDLFRPGYDIDERPIPGSEQKAFTTRINITFRFYREGEAMHGGDLNHRFSSFAWARTVWETRRDSSLQMRYSSVRPRSLAVADSASLLRADQKAKARSRLAPSPMKRRRFLGDDDCDEDPRPIDADGEVKQFVVDDMAFFWQCQSPGSTGSMKGCGFFRILDMRAEGRGPCVVDL